MPGSISPLNGSRDRTALLVTKHHDQLRTQMLHGVLDAAQDCIVHDVAGHTNDEQIAQTLIEKEFRWYSRIGTPEDDRKRMLSCNEFLPAGHRFIRMLLLVFDVSSVSCKQACHRFVG